MTKPMTVAELAAHLGCSTKTIYKRVNDRTIPFQRIGRKIIFHPEEIDKWQRNRSEA